MGQRGRRDGTARRDKRGRRDESRDRKETEQEREETRDSERQERQDKRGSKDATREGGETSQEIGKRRNKKGRRHGTARAGETGQERQSTSTDESLDLDVGHLTDANVSGRDERDDRAVRPVTFDLDVDLAYNADTEVEDGNDDEDDDDDEGWVRNLRRFPKIPDFTVEAGLKLDVGDNPSDQDFYCLIITDEIINQWKSHILSNKYREIRGKHIQPLDIFVKTVINGWVDVCAPECPAIGPLTALDSLNDKHFVTYVASPPEKTTTSYRNCKVWCDKALKAAKALKNSKQNTSRLSSGAISAQYLRVQNHALSCHVPHEKTLQSVASFFQKVSSF
ncbi:hypothetical protein PoB_003338600 [Plakobranchus ocellatus]|uniref:Uncharacterized protein n=1 Tax=Plakobranchus ocellatus TaxID=259542 RepID=A0AAV4A6Q0_9GAST|nr:hypothetical protein PoB_003338600 [Plakobranchus ocellatus]